MCRDVIASERSALALTVRPTLHRLHTALPVLAGGTWSARRIGTLRHQRLARGVLTTRDPLAVDDGVEHLAATRDHALGSCRGDLACVEQGSDGVGALAHERGLQRRPADAFLGGDHGDRCARLLAGVQLVFAQADGAVQGAAHARTELARSELSPLLQLQRLFTNRRAGPGSVGATRALREREGGQQEGGDGNEDLDHGGAPSVSAGPSVVGA